MRRNWRSSCGKSSGKPQRKDEIHQPVLILQGQEGKAPGHPRPLAHNRQPCHSRRPARRPTAHPGCAQHPSPFSLGCTKAMAPCTPPFRPPHGGFAPRDGGFGGCIGGMGGMAMEKPISSCSQASASSSSGPAAPPRARPHPLLLRWGATPQALDNPDGPAPIAGCAEGQKERRHQRGWRFTPGREIAGCAGRSPPGRQRDPLPAPPAPSLSSQLLLTRAGRMGEGQGGSQPGPPPLRPYYRGPPLPALFAGLSSPS